MLIVDGLECLFEFIIISFIADYMNFYSNVTNFVNCVGFYCFVMIFHCFGYYLVMIFHDFVIKVHYFDENLNLNGFDHLITKISLLKFITYYYFLMICTLNHDFFDFYVHLIKYTELFDFFSSYYFVFIMIF